MNTLNRLDVYVFSLFLPSGPKIAPPSPSKPPSFLTSPNSINSHTVSPPAARLSNLPPTPRKRQRSQRRLTSKRTTSTIKLPPPSTPLLLRIVLALWSILLAFWRSLVGETRAERTKRRRRRPQSSKVLSAGYNVTAGVSSDDGSGSDTEALEGDGDGEGGGEGWVDPVTREPVEESQLDEPDEFAPTAIPSKGPDTNFSFRLRSAEKKESPSLTTVLEPPTPEPQKAFVRRITPPSILSNPNPPPRQARLLPNPMSTSLLDPSVPAIPASQTITATSSVHPASRIHQTPFHLQKTLILDLDETLIHSTSRPLSYAASAGGGLLGLSFGGLLGGRKARREGHTVEVVLNGRSTTYHVYKRPYVDHFLKKVSLISSTRASTHDDQVASWYTLVIYTASMPEYADPVIDWLDGGRGLFAKKLYRESCFLQTNGSYIKDLALVEADLSRVCFMDNSPISYSWNKGEYQAVPLPGITVLMLVPANALPIEGWTSDPYDEALLQSIPVLDSLRFVNDVRRVLGIRGFS